MSLVAHVDVDYFFAQVEELRLGLAPNSKPLGVQQNYEVASVNYAARKFGLFNRISVDQARRLCPDLVLVRGDNDVNGMRKNNPSRARRMPQFSSLFLIFRPIAKNGIEQLLKKY